MTIQNATAIMLADGQSLFREAIRMIVDGQADLTVVAEAEDRQSAVAEAKRTRPDVVVIDADLPGIIGTQAVRDIKDALPSCRILVLAVEPQPQQLSAALEDGANGFVTKTSPVADLLDSIRAVRDGKAVVPDDMLGSLLAHLLNRKRENAVALQKISKLTKRERQVLACLVDGADNAKIAAAFVISPETARTHIQNILTKLGVHSRLEATALVLHGDVLADLVDA
ncbi:MAG: response regulator transcription factor [Actinobacteria bacterium]|nr:response regulator transcription factor [Actinomycetota bacterium]